jgi:hypothetical protein
MTRMRRMLSHWAALLPAITPRTTILMTWEIERAVLPLHLRHPATNASQAARLAEVALALLLVHEAHRWHARRLRVAPILRRPS